MGHFAWRIQKWSLWYLIWKLGIYLVLVNITLTSSYLKGTKSGQWILQRERESWKHPFWVQRWRAGKEGRDRSPPWHLAQEKGCFLQVLQFSLLIHHSLQTLIIVFLRRERERMRSGTMSLSPKWCQIDILSQRMVMGGQSQTMAHWLPGTSEGGTQRHTWPWGHWPPPCGRNPLMCMAENHQEPLGVGTLWTRSLRCL